SAAKPMFTYCLCTSSSPSSEALNCGNCLSATAQALSKKASKVNLVGALSADRALACSALSATRQASSSVMSASSWLVTWGMRTQLRCRLAPESFWMRESGWRSVGPYLAKSTLGQGSKLMPPRSPPLEPAPAPAPAPDAEAAAGAAPLACATSCLTKPCTSSWVMRPLGPLPATCAMGTPSSRAKRRTEGEAWEVPDADADADGGWAVAAGATAAAPALGTGAGVCSGAGA